MQSDDLGLVPVAWRHRGPKGGWITTEKKQPWSEQPLYDAAAIERLVAERDDLRTAISTPEALHANMLRGGIPMLTIRQALHLHGADALATWDNAKATEAQRDKLKEALKPFAEAAESIDDTVPDRAEMWESPAAMDTTAADFRRARQALGEP